MDSGFIVKTVTARFRAAPVHRSLPFIHNLLLRAICQFLEVPFNVYSREGCFEDKLKTLQVNCQVNILYLLYFIFPYPFIL